MVDPNDDVEEIEAIEVSEESPQPSPRGATPPPLPPSVTGEQDALAAQRRTVKMAGPQPESPSPPSSGGARPSGDPSSALPPASGWFSSLSPTRPTWETTAVGGPATGDRPEEPKPGGRPGSTGAASGGKTVRIMVPMAEDPGATVPDEPATDDSSTLRMRTPFANQQVDDDPPADAGAPTGQAPPRESTTLIRVPLATDPEGGAAVPWGEAVTAPRRVIDDRTEVMRIPLVADPEDAAAADRQAAPGAGDKTALLRVPLATDPDEESFEPDPGPAREQTAAGPGERAPEPVVATVVMPVGRPVTTNEPAQPGRPPAPAAPRLGAARLERARVWRATTGDLEAAAELGAVGALDGRKADPTPTSPFVRPTRPRPGPGLIIPWLLFGLVIGAGLGFAFGRALGSGGDDPEARTIPAPHRMGPHAGERATDGVGQPAEASDEQGSDDELAAATAETARVDEGAGEAAPPADGTPSQQDPAPDAPSSEPLTAAAVPTEQTEAEGTGAPALAALVGPEATAAPELGADDVALADTEPEPSGPPSFAPDFWEPGNAWLFRYRRETPDDQPEFRELEYYFRRRVESVEPHPFGLLVTLVDEGGVAPPVTSQVLATASCLLDPDSLEARFCLPSSADALETSVAAGQSIGLAEVTDESESLAMSPGVGWVREASVDRDGQAHEAHLVGYRIGARVGGDVDQTVLTCDWRGELEQGQRVGRVGRDEGPEMEAAASWGLQGSLRRLDVPLAGAHGFAWLRAWYSDEQTVYQVLTASDDPDNPRLVDSDAPAQLVDLPLDEVKVWTDPEGLVDQVVLIFEGGGGTYHVRLVTVGADGPVDSELLPLSSERGARLNVVLLANLESCYVQIRRGRGQTMRHVDYQLTTQGPVRLAGEL